MNGFTDLFSDQPAAYAAARPRYPAALFAAIAAAAPARERAWDCGCGNGQAALGLAEHFACVEATDASAAQIAEARPDPRVRYTVAAAEASGLPAASCDAVCVAQALHWFDAGPFLAEVRRVLRPGGVFAAWGYAFFEVEPAIDAVVARRLLAPIAPHWAPQNRRLWDGYRGLVLPFEPLDLPAPAIELDWRLDELLAYVASWSAAKACVAGRGDAFLHAAHDALAPLWGPGSRRVRMPLHLRAGRQPVAH